MSRFAGRLTTVRQSGLVRRTGRPVAVTLAVGCLLTASAGAGDDDTPVPTPPVVSKPATDSPATKLRTARPMLAIPGMTVPTSRSSPILEAPKPAVAPGPAELSLDGPIEMRPPAEAPRAAISSTPARSGRPPNLGSTPADDPVPIDGDVPAAKKPPTGPKQVAQPVPLARSRPRFFGMIPGAPRPPAASPPSSRPSTPGRSVADDLQGDPAAETALKRRIERQAREVVGNRARSVEVKVAGKEALVQVVGVKLFQKRAVRKQLEGLPALSGLRSTIEVVE